MAGYATRSQLQFDEKRKKEPQKLHQQKLRQHCIRKIERLTKKQQLAKEDWRLLAETTLCHITTFNAHGGRDPATLAMQDWEDAERDKWKNKESLSALTKDIWQTT